MRIDWSALLRQPHTYLLVVGTGLGYAVLIGLAGPRPLAWLSGGGIAVTMLGTWAAGFREQTLSPSESSDLLEAQAFWHQIEQQAAKVPDKANATWQQVYAWATESQRFAERICERDPLMRTDLLEAMHTVMDLARQVAEALQVMGQIETPTYQQIARQRLQVSCDRMQDTHAQLQQLQDQVALSALDPANTQSSLPQRLQTLIAANKQILEAPRPEND